jgi:PAS domain S-box-containing protein
LKSKTKEQLLNELAELRRRVAELEAAEAEGKRAEEALRQSPEDRLVADETQELRLEHLAALIQASQVVTASLELDQVLAEIVPLASQVSDSDYTSVVLVDESGHMGQSAENVPGVPAIEYRVREEGFTSWIVHSRQAVVVDEIGEDGVVTPDLGKGAPRFANPHIVEAGVKSLAGLPLKVQGHLLGVLYLHSLRPAAFHGQLPLLTAFANQTAIAIENARLHETLRQELTDRKRAEEALRESEEKFRSVFMQSYDGISVTDEEGIIIEWNESQKRLTGLQAEEVLGKPVWDVLFELTPGESQNRERYKQLKSMLQQALQTGESPWLSKISEGEFARPDGTRRAYQSVIFPIKASNSFMLASTARDITDRKQAEEALRESEEKYRNLVERANDGITIIQDSLLKYVNPRSAAITGYTVEELINTKFANYIHPDELPKLVDHYERRMAGEDVMPVYETALRHRDGSRIDVELNAGVITYQGKPADLVIIRDITERKRAEQLLHTLNAAALAMERAITQEEIFAAVAEELKKLGFYCVVLLTDESQSRLFPRYLSYEAAAVKAAENLVGLGIEDFSVLLDTSDVFSRVVWKRQTVLTENAEELMQQLLPEPAKKFAGQIAKMLRIPKSIATPLIVRDQVIGVLEVQSSDLSEDDVPAITAFAHQMAAAWRKANLMRDLESSLEELTQTQAQLVQTQKMEAVGRLAGGVAHDFNNILTAITGYAELLLLTLGDLDPRHKDIEEIKKASGRASGLTRQLLAFSRKQVLQPRVLNLNAVVANMEKMLRRLIREDIELATVLDPALGRVKADPGQIEQVIMNLAVNARDAMPQGGKLTIETMNVYLDEDYARQHVDVQPGPYVMLAVSDTGVGMDEETLSHLFEPFFTTKEKGAGTGLGLATVYGIVKQSGGHIWVYSEPEPGTTFKIYLPRVEEAVELLQPGAALAKLPQGTETVLLVEDADMVRELARRVLLQNGYTVLVARHGGEALQVCEQNEGPLHLLVTDVVMPGGMSGRDLAENLAPLHPGMKVLYISGYTDNAIARHGVLEPGIAFLQKPFTPDSLVRKVREVLDAPQQRTGSL